MPFPVACACGQRFMAQDYLAGKQVSCPACGNPLLIASPGPAPKPPGPKPAPPAAAPARPAPKPLAGTPGIAVRCACGKAYKAPAAVRGKSLQCPACGQDVPIPFHSPSAAASPAAALGPDLMGANLFGADPFAAAQLNTAPIGYPQQPLPRPSHPGYGAPQADDGGKTKLFIILGVGAVVGAVLLGMVAIVLIAHNNATPIAANNTQLQQAINPPVTTPAPFPSSSISPPPASIPSAAAASTSVTPVEPAPPGINSGAFPPGFSGAPPSASASPDRPGAAATSSTNDPFEPPVSTASENSSSGGNPPRASRGSSSSSGSSVRSKPGSRQSADESGSRPVGRALATGLLEGQATGKVVGVRKVGEGDNLQAHYSWMTQILPFVGHQDIFDKIDFSKGMSDKANLQTGGHIIPEFLNPSDDRTRWKGFPFEDFALTHFVGMSGIEDARNVVAAKLPRSDPRAGVFGYDALATSAEITDGTSNTIMALGGGEITSPWVMGGGATIRGARLPYFDKISGFGSKGSNGVIVIMADGSVRQVSSNIDPAVFRAMCTIHGAEKIDLDSVAPLSTDK